MKVELIKRVWNKEPGTILDLEGDRLDLVMVKKYAKSIDDDYENKAIGKSPKNKATRKRKPKQQDFIGSKNFE